MSERLAVRQCELQRTAQGAHAQPFTMHGVTRALSVLALAQLVGVGSED